MVSLSRPQRPAVAKRDTADHERLFFRYSQDGMILLKVAHGGAGSEPRFFIEAENPTAIGRLTVLGQQPDFIGREISEVLPAWLHKKLAIHYGACVDAAQTRRYEIVHGGMTHESIATPILDENGTVDLIAVIMRDVGDRVLQEKKLNMALARAEEANRSKSEFFASMSHELRTPLNAILGFSEMMEKGFGGTLSNQHVEYAEHIHSSGQHLLAIISDILDLSKIEAGHFKLHESEIAVRDILEGCAQMVRERALRKGLHLVIDQQPGMPMLRADPVRIKQILLNLLSNAIKFTDTGGSVTLAVHHDADGFRFTVTDTGIGMNAGEIETAMQPFGQVEDAYARNKDGTGLGLPIAKQLAELHQGRLELASARSQGTVASLFLPPERASAR